MRMLLTTFCVAIASALCPLVNIETYIALTGGFAPTLGVWPITAAAARGSGGG